MFAWEPPYIKKVSEVRAKEVQLVQKGGIIRAINMAIFFASSETISVATFLTYFFG